MIIGLTGKTGSGKSTVSKMLKDMGFFICDADKVARQVVEKGSPLLEKLKIEFGEEVINPDGTLNRPKLAEKGFATRETTEKLNSLMHPAILEKSFDEMRTALSSGYKVAIYDAAALYESKADKLCDVTVCVCAPDNVRFDRIIKRDGLTREKALERMNAQRPDSYYSEKADFIIDNSPDKDLTEQVKELVRQLRL